MSLRDPSSFPRPRGERTDGGGRRQPLDEYELEELRERAEQHPGGLAASMAPYIDGETCEMRCFFAGWEGVSACDGSLVRAHLISKHRLKKLFPKGAWRDGERWVRQLPFEALTDPETAAGWSHISLEEIQADERVWIPACGGLTGIGGHHGELDNPNHALTISRLGLPASVEDFASEFGIERELERVYGSLPLEGTAA